MYEKKPLYRRVNTRARGVWHNSGPEHRWTRRTKAARAADAGAGGDGPARMRQGARRGLDYTPLFRFLISRVDQPWEPTRAEAAARLDSDEAIYWLVARSEGDRRPVVRIGESSMFSGLFVDQDGVLRKVDPSRGPETETPLCACCTWTFNGARLLRPVEG